jgi:hypothetical protein
MAGPRPTSASKVPEVKDGSRRDFRWQRWPRRSAESGELRVERGGREEQL